MRVLILGAGALGSLIGALLSKQNDVTLVGRKEHVSSIQAEGLRISGHTEMLARLSAVERVEDLSGYDYVFLTVKSYDTKSAMRSLGELPGSSTVVTMQNGLGNLETIAEYANSVIGGTTSHGAMLRGPGDVVHAGTGDTVAGIYKGVSEETLDSLAGELTACGMMTNTTENLSGEVWAKAIVNAGINPLTAILGARNGYLLDNAQVTRMLENVCKEAVEVATMCEIPLPEDDLVERTTRVARMTAQNMSSMLQDVVSKRRTEISSITGVIVSRGDDRGVPTPLNSALLAVVKGMENSYGV
jgi:2-dehydropantoate 2-reductase